MGDVQWATWAPALPVRRERPVRFWLVGLVMVVLAGVAVGLVVYQLARPRGAAAASDEGWGDFGAVLGGAAVGVLACVIAWLALLVALVRRYLAPGSRLAAAGASFGAVLAAALALAALGAVLASAGGSSVGSSGSVALLGAVQGAALGAAVAPPVMVNRFRR